MTEHGHQRVALVFVDGATVSARDSVEQLQATGRQRIRALRPGGLGQRREADEIDEQDGATPSSSENV
jgi:hypothetical protein